MVVLTGGRLEMEFRRQLLKILLPTILLLGKASIIEVNRRLLLTSACRERQTSEVKIYSSISVCRHRRSKTKKDIDKKFSSKQETSRKSFTRAEKKFKAIRDTSWPPSRWSPAGETRKGRFPG